MKISARCAAPGGHLVTREQCQHRETSRYVRASAWIIAIALLLAAIPSARAESTYLSGRIANVTSGADGLDVMLDTGVPTNCTGVTSGWMHIPEANKTMIAVVLIAWQNHSGATVYTNSLSAGICVINQFDPWEP